jgi:hypothetical protein
MQKVMVIISMPGPPARRFRPHPAPDNRLIFSGATAVDAA